MPAAPARLSIGNCWFNCSDTFWNTIRAVISVPPPGGNTTTTRTGRDGYGCDHAALHSKNSPATAPSNRIVFMRFLLEGLQGCPQYGPKIPLEPTPGVVG